MIRNCEKNCLYLYPQVKKCHVACAGNLLQKKVLILIISFRVVFLVEKMVIFFYFLICYCIPQTIGYGYYCNFLKTSAVLHFDLRTCQCLVIFQANFRYISWGTAGVSVYPTIINIVEIFTEELVSVRQIRKYILLMVFGIKQDHDDAVLYSIKVGGGSTS